MSAQNRGPATATTAQLKADIDAARTGDKVSALDPAAAPLGTDAEAGGAPPSPELIARAREAERRGSGAGSEPGATSRKDTRAGSKGPDGGGAGPIWKGVALGGGAAALVAAGLGWFVLHH